MDDATMCVRAHEMMQGADDLCWDEEGDGVSMDFYYDMEMAEDGALRGIDRGTFLWKNHRFLVLGELYALRAHPQHAAAYTALIAEAAAALPYWRREK